jgi:hypothetical protein
LPPSVFPRRVPKVTRPSQSKAAIAERRLPPEWYFISFATDSENLGAAFVWASGELTAYDEAVKLGIAPCPEQQALAGPVGEKHLRKIQLDLVNRLLTEKELRRRLPTKGYDE